MPAIETTEVAIACDNPACPSGHPATKLPNDLRPDDRLGWIVVTIEAYGVSYVTQHIFCSLACAGATIATLAADGVVLPTAEALASTTPVPAI